MRPVFLLAALPFVLLAGCGSSQPYTALDLRQVNRGWASLKPIYFHFRNAYYGKNAAAMLHAYHQERRECRLMDQIDKRDTINPNTRLFEASSDLDSICNTIESVENMWAENHHKPYDKNLPLADPPYFEGTDQIVLVMPSLLAAPAKLS
ncbi:MAG: hypothetical protein ACRDFS_12275 [Chloroflexota bacterium]